MCQGESASISGQSWLKKGWNVSHSNSSWTDTLICLILCVTGVTIHATTIVQAIPKCLIVQYPKKCPRRFVIRKSKIVHLGSWIVRVRSCCCLFRHVKHQPEISLESTVDGKLGTEVSRVSEYFSRIMLERCVPKWISCILTDELVVVTSLDPGDSDFDTTQEDIETVRKNDCKEQVQVIRYS